MSGKKPRIPYEVLQGKWMMDHTWDQLGVALRRDIELSITNYEFLKSHIDRKLTTDEALIEVGASLISAGVRGIREEQEAVRRLAERGEG